MGGAAKVSVAAGVVACDVLLDGSDSEGERTVAEPDHQEDQDDEVLGAAAGVLDASAGGCCSEDGCCVEDEC